MRNFLWLCLFAPLSLFGQVLDGHRIAKSELETRLQARFQHFETTTLALDELSYQAEQKGQVVIPWQGQEVVLFLEYNPIQSPELVWTASDGEVQWEEPVTPFATYRGVVAGDATSLVRLLIEPEMIMGYFRSGETWVFVDPLSSYDKEANPGEVVIYDVRDVYANEAVRCGAVELEEQAQVWQEQALERHGAAQKSNQLKILEVATDTDAEYYGAHFLPGGIPSVNLYITGILNGVDGIFTSEVNVTLQITFQNVNTSIPFDAYAATDPCVMLNTEMFNTWNTPFYANQNWDVAHLFTGKALSAATCLPGNPTNIVGLANIGTVCLNRPGALGLSQDFTTDLSQLVKLTAHEFGHKFGAQHIDPPATCGGNGRIMCSIIQPIGPNLFSNQTKTVICAHVANWGCCLDNPVNTPPVAMCATNLTFNAGSQCTVSVPPSVVDNGSFDPDGCNFFPLNLSVSPAGPYGIGTTPVTLTVTDSQGATSSCQTTITVTGTNSPPIGSAGFPRVADEGAFVSLLGSGSDPDPGQTVSFTWTQTAGPPVTLLNPATATPSFFAPAVPLNSCTKLEFRLDVSDPCGATVSDTVSVSVNDVLILQDVAIRDCLRIFPCNRYFIWRLANGSIVRGNIVVSGTGSNLTFTGRTSAGDILTGRISGIGAKATLDSAAGVRLGSIRDSNITNNFPCP